MFIIWGFLIDLGIFIIKYMKTHNNYTLYHFLIFFIVLFLLLISEFLVINKSNIFFYLRFKVNITNKLIAIDKINAFLYWNNFINFGFYLVNCRIIFKEYILKF